MENLTLDLDFTGITIGEGVGYLPPGLDTGQVLEFAHFEDSNRLYVYMLTNGIRHKQSFNLDKGLVWLGRFLVSAGCPRDKISDRKIKGFKFQNVIGHTIHFNYTPPNMDENGRAMDGSWPKYEFYTKDRYQQLQDAANLNPQDIEVEGTNGGGKPVAQAAQAAKSSEDFDFLLDDMK